MCGMANRGDHASERARLELAVDEAFAVLKRTPKWTAYVQAEMRLYEHRVLYGTGDLSQVPTGILNARHD
jgi:hypothetical protein